MTGTTRRPDPRASNFGAPLEPASWPRLRAADSRAYPVGPSASSNRCRPWGSGWGVTCSVRRRGLSAIEGDFRPENRGQIKGPGRLGEPNDPVEPVVVGQRQCFQAEPIGFFGQLLGVAGTIEEAEVRMAVKFGVRRDVCAPALAGDRLIRLAFSPPRRAVAARIPCRRPRARRPERVRSSSLQGTLRLLKPTS